MHNCLIGVSGKLMNLWFSQDPKGTFVEYIDPIDELIKGVKPPGFISKPPPPIKKLKNWKGFLSFFLF